MQGHITSSCRREWKIKKGLFKEFSLDHIGCEITKPRDPPPKIGDVTGNLKHNSPLLPNQHESSGEVFPGFPKQVAAHGTLHGGGCRGLCIELAWDLEQIFWSADGGTVHSIAPPHSGILQL